MTTDQHPARGGIFQGMCSLQGDSYAYPVPAGIDPHSRTRYGRGRSTPRARGSTRTSRLLTPYPLTPGRPGLPRDRGMPTRPTDPRLGITEIELWSVGHIRYPAGAGMYLANNVNQLARATLPRARGDVPRRGCAHREPYVATPRARG